MKSIPIRSIALALFCAFGTAEADVVSFNVERYGTIPRSATDTAGVVNSPYWNDGWGNYGLADGGYNGATASNLWDNNGNASTIDATFVTFNTWTDNNMDADPGTDTDGTHNIRMLHGYLNAGEAGWNPPTTVSSITLSSIPYTSYDIYVYFNSASNTRIGDVTVGSTTYHFTSMAANVRGADGNAVFAQTTNTTDYTTSADYAVFTGLTGTSQTMTTYFGPADGAWGGIAGFQIVGTLPGSPTILEQPANQTIAVYDDATFTVSAAGDPAPTYQWEYSSDGSTGWAAISGETNATLDLIGVDFPDEGYYRVVITNTNGTVTSDAASLSVYYSNPIFDPHPINTYAESGSTVTLTSDALTYGTPSYQWYKDGNPISGANDFELVLTNVDSTTEGDYYLEVTDDIAPNIMGNSNVAHVYVFAPWSGLVSYEPFNTTAGYSVNLLPLQNPTIAGYMNQWERVDFGDAGAGVTSGTLNFVNSPNALDTSGDKASVATDTTGGEITGANSGRTYRLLTPQLVVADNTTGTRYLSFLFQSGQETGASIYQTLSLNNGNGDGNRHFDAGLTNNGGQSGSEYDFGVNDSYSSTGVAADTGVHLFVVKFVLSADNASDSVTVWLDPALGAGEPTTGGITVTGQNLLWDRLVLSDYEGNSAAWDEIRWGSTFDSVTPSSEAAGYTAWIAGYPGVGALTGFGEDADGDGIPNGVESVFGTDPSASTTGITQVARSGNTVTFQHPVAASVPADVSSAYEWSTDLVNWHADGASDGTNTVDFAAAPASGTATVTATITGTAPAKLFARLKAIVAP